MKIVKFKDGSFGARKFTLSGYKFLHLRGLDEGEWFQHFVSVPDFARGTLEEVEALTSRAREMDCGEPIPKLQISRG